METEETVQVYNHLGEPVYAVKPEKGYYKRGDHFYHVHNSGITHLNIDLINTLQCIWLAKGETLELVTKEIFQQEVRNAVFNIGIYEYVK